MNETEHKLQVLSDIAHVLNEHHVKWAVGGSLLLYFKNVTDSFHDLDLMIAEADAETVKICLSAMGILHATAPNPGYLTRVFMEFTVQDVDIDVIAGFVIVKDGVAYECPLNQIAETVMINNEDIPLQSVAEWRRYYSLMGRDQRVQQIDDWSRQ